MNKTVEAIDDRLSAMLSNALGIEGLWAGQHVVRNASGAREKKRLRKLWAAEIRPPASPAALIGLIEDSESIKVAACLGLSEGIFTVGPMEVQSDPVSQELCKLDLWSGGGEIPFGGFTYRLIVSTTHLTARLDLHRATHVSRLALATAIFDSLRATIGEDPRWSGFLGEWQHELAFLQSSAT